MDSQLAFESVRLLLKPLENLRLREAAAALPVPNTTSCVDSFRRNIPQLPPITRMEMSLRHQKPGLRAAVETRINQVWSNPVPSKLLPSVFLIPRIASLSPKPFVWHSFTDDVIRCLK